MGKTSYRYENLSVLMKELEADARALEDVADDIANSVATEVMKNAQKNVPVLTGQLKLSLTKSKPAKLVRRITASTPYVLYVEYGTRFMHPRYFMHLAVVQTKAKIPSIIARAILKWGKVK